MFIMAVLQICCSSILSCKDVLSWLFARACLNFCEAFRDALGMLELSRGLSRVLCYFSLFFLGILELSLGCFAIVVLFVVLSLLFFNFREAFKQCKSLAKSLAKVQACPPKQNKERIKKPRDSSSNPKISRKAMIKIPCKTNLKNSKGKQQIVRKHITKSLAKVQARHRKRQHKKRLAKSLATVQACPNICEKP